MKVLLNSIAPEPNRWTKEKVPYFRLHDLLDEVAGAGFDAIEVWQNHVATLDEIEVCRLAREARQLGVTFPVIGMYPLFHLTGAERAGELARFERMFGSARALGTGVIKVFAGRISSADITAEQWDASVGFAREVLEGAGEELLFTVETHGNTLADSCECALRFVQAVGSPRLKVCWQPYDFTDTEKDQTDYLKKVYRSGRALLSSEPSGAWVPPIDLSITSIHGPYLYVNGRRKWKSAGGYPTLTHGGITVLETLVPFIEIERN